MLNAGISKVGALKPVAAMRNSSVVNNASNWVGRKFYGKTFEGGVDELSGKVIGAGLQEGAKDATISSVKYAATTDQWNPKDQAVAGVMGFAGGFTFGAAGSGINQGVVAAVGGKNMGKLATNSIVYGRNYASDWVTNNGADLVNIGLDQKLSPEEKGQKLVQKVGVNTIKSVGTAGAKTYGGNIKDARAGSASASGTNSSNIQTGSSDAGVTDE